MSDESGNGNQGQGPEVKAKRPYGRSLSERETKFSDLQACRRAVARLFGEIARGEVEAKAGQAMVACVKVAVDIHKDARNKAMEDRLAALEARIASRYLPSGDSTGGGSAEPQ